MILNEIHKGVNLWRWLWVVHSSPLRFAHVESGRKSYLRCKVKMFKTLRAHWPTINIGVCVVECDCTTIRWGERVNSKPNRKAVPIFSHVFLWRGTSALPTLACLLSCGDTGGRLFSANQDSRQCAYRNLTASACALHRVNHPSCLVHQPTNNSCPICETVHPPGNYVCLLKMYFSMITEWSFGGYCNSSPLWAMFVCWFWDFVNNSIWLRSVHRKWHSMRCSSYVPLTKHMTLFVQRFRLPWRA